MTHRRKAEIADRVPEWLVGLLIAIVIVTAGYFYLESIEVGDDPVVGDEEGPPETESSSLTPVVIVLPERLAVAVSSER